MRRKLLSGLLAVVCVAPDCALPADKVIPAPAAALIGKVHRAAAKRNFEVLKNSMADEFVWSFGGDGDTSQALEAWRADPSYLIQLRRVTSARCGVREDLVECPANAGVGYRAGFRKTEGGWRMVYFVAGD